MATIDERLQKLNKELTERLSSSEIKIRIRVDGQDERLDAVTQTLELVSYMQLQTEKELDRIAVSLGRLAKYVNSITINHGERIKKLEGGKK